MALLLKNGRVIDPSRNVDQVTDLLIVDGRIAAFGAEAISAEAEILDISGLVVCPGLVDLHTHLREPGFEQKETIATGARAGAAGGYTTLCCMPLTSNSSILVADLEFDIKKRTCHRPSTTSPRISASR